MRRQRKSQAILCNDTELHIFIIANKFMPTSASSCYSLDTLVAIPSWYDIVGLNKRANEVCKGIEESRERLNNLIQTEMDAGIKRNRIVLAGFSQGGALSLYTGMQLSTTDGEPPPCRNCSNEWIFATRKWISHQTRVGIHTNLAWPRYGRSSDQYGNGKGKSKA